MYLYQLSVVFFCLMLRRPPISTRTVTLSPSTRLFRSPVAPACVPRFVREQVPRAATAVRRPARAPATALVGLSGCAGRDRVLERPRPSPPREIGRAHV